MGERTIAEIIGWTRCNMVNCDTDHPDCFTPHWVGADCDYAGHGDPTVDDLLAWLVQFRFASFHFGFVGSYDGFYVDWGRDAAHAPTLCAALEAAVRAVDQASIAAPSSRP